MATERLCWNARFALDFLLSRRIITTIIASIPENPISSRQRQSWPEWTARAMPNLLRCHKCGSNKFALPNQATDDTPVSCARCGAQIGRWGNIRFGILEKAKNEGVARAKTQKAS